jgi:isoleucyl-tRNA synthetase
MYTASPPGQPRRFSQALVQKSLRQYLLTLWNCYSFFVTYAETEWHRLQRAPIADADLPDLDQWIIGVLSRLVIDTTHRLETYDLTAAARGISDFVDTLSNWYIRRSRDRFWASLDRPAESGGGIDAEVERDKRAAYQTLRRCLVTVAQLSAPFTPFVAEELWQNLERSVNPGAAVSVHLSVWPQKPDAALIAATDSICEDMSVVLRVVSLGRAARMDQNIKVRQPLHKVLVQVPNAAVRQAVLRHEAVIRDELNVERVQLVEGGEQLVHYTLRPNLPKLGKKYGKRVKPIQDALLATQGPDAARIAEAVLSEREIVLATADGPFTLEADEVLLSAQAPEGLAARTEEGVVVAITTEITPELRDRGLARELVRAIGELRKKAGCKVSDRVQIGAHTTDGSIAAAFARYQSFIEGETLSTLSPQPLPDATALSILDLDEASVELSLRPA